MKASRSCRALGGQSWSLLTLVVILVATIRIGCHGNDEEEGSGGLLIAASLAAIRNSFFTFRDELPKGVLGDVVSLQSDMIEAVRMANVFRNHMQYYDDYYRNFGPSAAPVSGFDGSGADFGDISDLAGRRIGTELHTDIVLVGFPATTVEAIRDKWFDNLGREDLGK
jgi:hypothetical protein